MLSGELMGVNALSGEIQREVISVGGSGGDAPIKTISVDGVEVKPDNKKNVNIDLSGKVDKVSTPSSLQQLYSKNINGTQTMMNVSSSMVGSSVVQRQANSHISVPREPQTETDATAKKYVDDKFNGASKPITYDTYSEMITALNGMTATDIKRGQDIFIVQTGVPDVWVAYIEEANVPYTYVDDDTFVNELLTNGVVQVGYYKLGYLETQKVDLTEYVKNTDYATSSKAGIVKVSTVEGTQMQNDTISVVPASKWAIDNRRTYNSNEVISPSRNLDYAVKKALADCSLAEKDPDNDWTDEEKASASNLIGAVKQVQYSQDQTFVDGSDAGVIGRLYMRFRDNTENSIVANCQNTRYSVPVRDSTGNFYVGNPTQLYHTVNRKYLEDNYTNEIAENVFNNGNNTYTGTAGLFMFDGGGKGGIFKSTAGGDGANRFRVKKATFSEIDNRSPSTYHDAGVGSANHCCPITPANIDYAVKKALTQDKLNGFVYNNVDYSWTDAEKAQVRSFLGIDALIGNINTALETILGV